MNHDVRSHSEKSLWLTVLQRGLKDALFPAPTSDKHDALNWVLVPNQDFIDICTLAGFDPVKVREAVIILLDMSPTQRRYHYDRLVKERPNI